MTQRRETKSARTRARRAFVCLAALLCSGCQFLQNEFATLDRVPPSVRALDQPAPIPW